MNSMRLTHTLFPLGEVVATPGALNLLAKTLTSPIQLLRRHAQGDWGDLCAEDRAANQQALKYGSRLFSSYNLPNQQTIWIITEANRAVTTVLLPEEY
jgi:hypothetical protein